MLTLVLAILLAVISLIAISLQRTYSDLPDTELKRRARAGDEFASALYKAVAYGASTEVLLWVITGLAAVGFFVVVATNLSAWLAALLSLLLVWIGFAWLPKTRPGYLSRTTARYLSSFVAWLINLLHPILSRVTYLLSRNTKRGSHTGLFQRDDLVRLLRSQKSQGDNRISADELRIAEGALTFGDKVVRDIMTPRRAVKAVATADSIGPHLMDELHASGHSRFPVYQDKADNIVGTLYAKDLINHQGGGTVRDLMKREVFYVHDEQNLRQVLGAFLKTKHHMFIVVNSFEEITGVISIEDVLEQIIGKPIIDEFDKYNDMRAVAALAAKKEHKEQVPEKAEPKEPEQAK